jgi:hypothetical protein
MAWSGAARMALMPIVSLAPAEISFQILASSCRSGARRTHANSAWRGWSAPARRGSGFSSREDGAGGLDELSRPARDAERHPGEAHLVAGHRRHAMERAARGVPSPDARSRAEQWSARRNDR